MGRDGTRTREQILRAGERLFARRGVHSVSVREITEAAEQRNASAVHYHFGSRDGLVLAIHEKHQGPMDAERRAMVADLEAAGRGDDLRALVETIVLPMARALDAPDGRDYLRLVPQLIDQAGVRVRSGRTPADEHRNLQLILGCLAPLPDVLRRERLATVLSMITTALGDRARSVDRGRTSLLVDDETFVTNLVDMAVAALDAPVRIRTGRITV